VFFPRIGGEVTLSEVRDAGRPGCRTGRTPRADAFEEQQELSSLVDALESQMGTRPRCRCPGGPREGTIMGTRWLSGALVVRSVRRRWSRPPQASIAHVRQQFGQRVDFQASGHERRP
jgi:hypothetical protein